MFDMYMTTRKKMHKKYFFFDIDGTLTDRSTGEIVPSALATLKSWKQQAILSASLLVVLIIKQEASWKRLACRIWCVMAVLV